MGIDPDAGSGIIQRFIGFPDSSVSDKYVEPVREVKTSIMRSLLGRVTSLFKAQLLSVVGGGVIGILMTLSEVYSV